MRSILKKIVYAAFLLGFLLSMYMCCIEPFRLVITRYEVETIKWTYDRPLTIALISDVHAISPWMNVRHIEKIVEATNNLKPDVILLLGDYVGTHPFGWQVLPEDGVRPYQSLKASCGVYAVIGNHDLHGSDSAGWPEALLKTGIPTLRNKAKEVECHGQHFWIAGLDELWFGQTDVKNTINQVKNNRPIVVMMHNPDSFVEISNRVALSVAGHTHGGQIVLPLYGPIAAVVPSEFGNRFVYGHIQEDGKDLIVSSGLGMTGLPLRLLRPPEISLITMKKALKSSE